MNASQTLTQAEAELYCKQCARNHCLKKIKSSKRIPFQYIADLRALNKEIDILRAQIAFAKAFGEESNA